MKVTVYTKANCQPCRATKWALDRRGVQYVEVGLDDNAEALERVMALGHQAAPVVVVDEQTHWSGYRPDRIAELAA